jgi:hypothetical protein
LNKRAPLTCAVSIKRRRKAKGSIKQRVRPNTSPHWFVSCRTLWMTRCFTKTRKYLPGHRPNGENRVQRRIHALHVLAESQSGLNVGNQGGSGEAGAFGSIGVAHPNTEIGQREIAPSQFELWPGALERQTAPASRAMEIRLHEDGLRRSDAFSFYRNPGSENRDWGTACMTVEDRSYSFTLPSSLFRYTHGSPDYPKPPIPRSISR